MSKYDLIVIGGGPAGYVGAIRAAQLGKKVACVEMDRAGGTCLNWGCIPTKSLLRNAELYQTHAAQGGRVRLQIRQARLRLGQVIGRSRTVSDRLAGGIEFLFKKNGIDYILGKGSVPEAGKVEIEKSDGGKETIEGDKILIATGCKTRELPDFPINGKSVIGSNEAMILKPQPKSMIIIGAGAIGVEFAYFYNAFGTKVTIVEMLPQPAAGRGHRRQQGAGALVQKAEDPLLKPATRSWRRRTPAAGRDHGAGRGQRTRGARGGCRLVAIGVAPVLPGGLEPELDRGYIVTDANYQTSIPGVYAAGDIIGPPWLAPRRQLRGDPGGRGDVHRQAAKEGRDFSGLHLLPTAGRQRRPHRTRCEGEGPRLQGRHLPVPSHRQSPGGRRGGRVRRNSSSASRTAKF